MKPYLPILLIAAMTPEAPFNPFAQQTVLPENNALAARYNDCIDLISEDVEIGRIAAEQWTAEGGGAPAMHCRAIGDLKAGFPKLAAIRLMQIAERDDAGDGLVRARYLQQATMAWLEAGELGYADETIAEALKLAPNSGELSLTMGLVHAANERWQATIETITAAEEQNFVSADGYVARGQARKALSDNPAAAEDVVAALRLDPMHLDALVLRGELQQLGIRIDARYRRNTEN